MSPKTSVRSGGKQQKVSTDPRLALLVNNGGNVMQAQVPFAQMLADLEPINAVDQVSRPNE